MLDIARRYSLGYEEIIRANPHVDMWLPGEGTDILLPGRTDSSAGSSRRDRGESSRASAVLLSETQERREACGHHLSG